MVKTPATTRGMHCLVVGAGIPTSSAWSCLRAGHDQGGQVRVAVPFHLAPFPPALAAIQHRNGRPALLRPAAMTKTGGQEKGDGGPGRQPRKRVTLNVSTMLKKGENNADSIRTLSLST